MSRRRIAGRSPLTYKKPEFTPGYFELPLLDYEARYGHTGSVHRYVNGVCCFTIDKYGRRMLVEIRGSGEKHVDESPPALEAGHWRNV